MDIADLVLKTDFGAHCEGYRVEAVEEAVRNEYRMATKLMYCGRDRRSTKGKGGIGVIKVINGKRMPHVLLLAWGQRTLRAPGKGRTAKPAVAAPRSGSERSRHEATGGNRKLEGML